MPWWFVQQTTGLPYKKDLLTGSWDVREVGEASMSLLQLLFRRRLNISAVRSIELCEYFLDRTLRVAGPVLIALAVILIR